MANGFYFQSEVPDDNEDTSDGLYVYVPGANTVWAPVVETLKVGQEVTGMFGMRVGIYGALLTEQMGGVQSMVKYWNTHTSPLVELPNLTFLLLVNVTVS